MIFYHYLFHQIMDSVRLELARLLVEGGLVCVVVFERGIFSRFMIMMSVMCDIIVCLVVRGLYVSSRAC